MAPPKTSLHQSVARFRVRYAETDQMGVVYYANYLVWFEVARCEWLRAAGWTYAALEQGGTVLPVIEAHCDYRVSTHYDDEIHVRTTCTWLSPVRLRFDYEVLTAGADFPAAVGHTIHAAVDLRGRPRRLPENVRSLFP